ncbi:hypothetical protein [Halorubrum sp. N11]|uniref:hypothetical protein n=1 Tax=Halorubrum sp. N11 TaxID=3402276 RepID=UPI003EBDDF96
MPDEDDTGDATEGGRLDRTTMQTLGRRAETHPLVDTWRFEPDRLSPRSLVVSLDATAYPDAVDTARIEIHWFVTGDYYFHYVEKRGASQFQCRWDRHPKTDAPRSHVHPPADASGVESSPLGDHHLAVLFAVLDWVTERVETLHDEPNRSA